MSGPILEREHELAELAEAMRAAAAGRGSVALVYGEAGIGKSSLVDLLRRRIPAEGRLLVGHCDDFATARPLGPLRDLEGVGADLARALDEGEDRDRLLTALRAELEWGARPTVLAIEDVHWADEATLDVLRFLVRRIAALPVVLVLTYRDELASDHPLLGLLGAVTGEGSRRLPLRRLSAEAVRELSLGTPVDAAEVYAVTSGNPFFVSEVLGSGTRRVPATVVDAVLGRMKGLDAPVREAVQQLSVVPNAIERRLVDVLVNGGSTTLVAAEECGLLRVTPSQVQFRHELTRHAIVDALPGSLRAALNARVLAALVDAPELDLARIVHHAGEAGDRDAIVRYGPDAARTAAANGAHREAAAQYRTVLGVADAFPPAERAALLEAYAEECYTIADGDNAILAQEEAIELRRSLGDARAEVVGLRWLSRYHWWNVDRPAAEDAARQAVAAAEALGDPRLLALAFTNVAQLAMTGQRFEEADAFGARAEALARQLGDQWILSHALQNRGAARGGLGLADGASLIEESLRTALAADDVDNACRAYGNLTWHHVERFEVERAELYARAGLELAERSEHLAFETYLWVQRSLVDLARASWDDAERRAAHGADSWDFNRCEALNVIGRARARRGASDASSVLDEALELARRLGEPQWIAPAASGVAEAAWLRGDLAAAVAAARPAFELLHGLDAIYHWSELAYWLGKAGHRVEVRPVETPFGLLLAGRWREAASFWQTAGCRYHQALALEESADPADLLLALDVLDAIEAAPLAALLRRRLRDQGVERVPRGPRPTTRKNVAGLTARQAEVLELLAQGKTNAEIADELVLSVRTVGNHVAAILDKLGVRRREDAAAELANLLES